MQAGRECHPCELPACLGGQPAQSMIGKQPAFACDARPHPVVRPAVCKPAHRACCAAPFLAAPARTCSPDCRRFASDTRSVSRVSAGVGVLHALPLVSRATFVRAATSRPSSSSLRTAAKPSPRPASKTFFAGAGRTPGVRKLPLTTTTRPMPTKRHSLCSGERMFARHDTRGILTDTRVSTLTVVASLCQEAPNRCALRCLRT